MRRILTVVFLITATFSESGAQVQPSGLVHFPTTPKEAQAPAPGGILNKNHYSSIRVPKKEKWVAMVDSIYVDTLILEDKASITFPLHTLLMVENAFIGDQCRLSSAGADAVEEGVSGETGRNLYLILVIKELGSLVVDTHGGDGAMGSTGMVGASGVNISGGGGPGGPGGNGGDGGALKLFYSCDGFLPVFNGTGTRSIQLIYHGGKAGVGGDGGKGGTKLMAESSGRTYACNTCTPAASGARGNTGTPGKDGELRLERIPD